MSGNINNNCGGKRKILKSVSLNTKLHALNDLREGVSVTTIATSLNVTNNTVKNWQKNEEKLLKWKNEHDNSTGKRKRMSNVSNHLVDKATWLWFQEKCTAGITVQGSLIRTQARYFNTMFGKNADFEASNGWLYKWQERHNIRCLTIDGEKKLSATTNIVENYKIEFHDFVKNDKLSLDQIFSCDETSLNFKMLPKKSTLTANCQPLASENKEKNDRVAIMACCNATGTFKLPLTVVGKYAKPRAIKDLTLLPVYYKNQKPTLMTAFFYKKWFENEFVPKVHEFLRKQGLPIKAVLFMDNRLSYLLDMSIGNIKIKFFPPNTSGLIQPMSQGCLQNLKSLYRQSLMAHVIDSINNRQVTLTQCLKEISLRDVIYWIVTAWQSVNLTTIRKSWDLVSSCLRLNK